LHVDVTIRARTADRDTRRHLWIFYTDDATEGMLMLNTKILLMSSMSPAAAWVASINSGPSLLLVFQVVCAIAISFALFMVILRATDRTHTQHMQAPARSQSRFAPRRQHFPAA
jgi:mannitol-specific phosphotransferase system IIBC component